MSAHGFYIKRLALSGVGLSEAAVDLSDGLNVITGPSDTGKTFIFQCVDFMLGASKVPESIPEAEGYDTVSMSIVSRLNGGEYLLQRGLRGGALEATFPDGSNKVLGATHDPDSEDTISHLLLRLSGLANKVVRTNARGTTRKLSFRDVSRLIVVDEESIITKRSPILTGQYTAKTTERNVFRLLLTSVDDSSVREEPDPRLAREKESGRSEVLDKVRESLLDRIRVVGIEGTVEELRQQLERTESDIHSVSVELNTEQRSATELENSRRESWSEMRRIESRQAVIEELQARFTLLDEQYASDLLRLESIAEAGWRLDQLSEDRCPVCGALPEHHVAEHHQESASPAAVASASQAEAERTRRLKADLTNAQIDNVAELESLNIRRESLRDNLSRVRERLEEATKPRLQELVLQLRQSQERRVQITRLLDLHEQVIELDAISEGKDDSVGRGAVPASPGVATGEAEEFSKEVESLLRSWNFPHLDRVVFSEEDQDVVISGRKRASHGKGVRAISHAAFNIGLADYCANREMPHPSCVILDSPLVVYREPDDDEGEFSTDVKDMFYRSLARRDIPVQTIVLENDVPPDDVERDAYVIKFTGSNIGRRGFIPPKPDAAGTGS